MFECSEPAPAAAPPSAEHIAWFEQAYRVSLPRSFRELLTTCNGGVPTTPVFDTGDHERLIERFLCLVDDPNEEPLGDYDITIVITDINDRLGDADEIGTSLVPFAALFAGDFACLDYRGGRDEPAVGVWDHERSLEFQPFVVPVADSLEAFADLCRSA